MTISPISSVNTMTMVPQKGNESTTAALLEPAYSDKAGGKTWSANIEQQADFYTATVPNLPGATASGPSVERVENTLSSLISFFA